MMIERPALIEVLADGRFHSGEALGQRLGVTRAAVWKQIRSLKSLGLNIQSVPGRGYRLPHAIEFLEADAIIAGLSKDARREFPALDVFPEIDSTNCWLKKQAAQGAPSGSVCLAELQLAGRGRQGREWFSPFGCNLYSSLLWRFDAGPAALVGLSLVAGVVLTDALIHISGVPDIGLKWPNDVVFGERKLAGILVEIAGEAAGPSYAVIGVGINIRMPDAAEERIDQPWTDLSRVASRMVSRNALAAEVLERLATALRKFDQQGLAPFLDAWRSRDSVAGKPVDLRLPDRVVQGRAHGIDDSGALIIQIGDELRRFSSGEVSVRVRP